jgi:hypothetical protein
MPDELMPVLEVDDFAAVTELNPVHVRFRDQLFYSNVQGIVKGVFDKTKATRYRLSDAWTTTLRTFLTGGGANVRGYGSAIDKGSRHSAQSIQLMPLPMHPRLTDFHGTITDYQRISVACGLAQDAFSLGRIIPAKDVADDRAPTLHVRERPDSDELYG